MSASVVDVNMRTTREGLTVDITVERISDFYQQGRSLPQLADIPPDIREALLKWLAPTDEATP